ncbi:B12-binding domain-containing radical SAM protein [Treponema sp. J25]|uniref:B12-binding domain-containing radical SAM protein n=1 Tax=Treponema sp. J25 TaxID=2094121 RepID=UPI0010443070|nr:B12-binding domain-containing radical SAM protein [Treponema sp. J25]TCW61726.1 B12-binding domain-containing radical SAM protein [Treponema sp. J25]
MTTILLTTINAKWIHPSLALRLLKANLGTLEEKTKILEFALRQPLEDKVRAILQERPRILGLSVYIWNHLATLRLIEALEEAWAQGIAPRPIIILGGPEVSFCDDRSPIIQKADLVIRGEGELAFRELCEGLLTDSSWEQSPSIRHVAGKCIYTHPTPLDTIDPGYRLYTEEDLSQKITYVEASRGCPFGCEFCLSSLDRTVREFPLEPFLSWMEHLIQRGAKTFKFLDRTFNLDIDRARRIMEFFLERLQPGMNVHFEMVPSIFSPQLQETLRRFPSGSLRIEVGIQTFTDHVARRIGRPSNPHKEMETLSFLRDHTKAIVHADLIAGLPGETLESFADSFNQLWTCGPTEIQLGILKKLPGTPIARHDTEWGMVYESNPPYEVLETRTMSKPSLDRIKNMARFWELIVNRGHFEDLLPRLFPEKEPPFWPFLELSDYLLSRFGRNWGIERRSLREALEEYLSQ